MGYEEDFLRFCQSMLSDVDKRIRRARQRLSLSSKESNVSQPSQVKNNDEKVNVLTERINGLLVQVEKLGTEGKVEEAQGIMKLCEQLKDEREALRKASEANHWYQTAEIAAAQEKQMEVCEVCGAFLIVGDAQQRVDDHLMGKQHVGYAKLKDAVDEILNKREQERSDREKLRDKEREERRRSSKDEDRRREERRKRVEDDHRHELDRDRPRRRSQSSERSRHRHSRRSRSKDRKSHHSRSKDRKSQRSRSKERNSHKSRSRERIAQRSRSKDRSSFRSQSKDHNSHSKSKDKERSRKRSGSSERRSHSRDSGRNSKRSRSCSSDQHKERRDRKDKNRDYRKSYENGDSSERTCRSEEGHHHSGD